MNHNALIILSANLYYIRSDIVSLLVCMIESQFSLVFASDVAELLFLIVYRCFSGQVSRFLVAGQIIFYDIGKHFLLFKDLRRFVEVIVRDFDLHRAIVNFFVREGIAQKRVLKRVIVIRLYVIDK
jgi:hypothetical protein